MSYLGTQTRILEVVEKLIEKMQRDFINSRQAGIIKEREEAYRSYYLVHPIETSVQRNPLIFVDAGFHAMETDVSVLMVINLGGCVRDSDGRLRYTNQVGDYVFPESLLLYARWIERENEKKLDFTVDIIPLSRENLLYTEEKSERVSAELTRLVNERIIGESEFRRFTLPKMIRVLKKTVKYIEGLLEVAYAIKLQQLVGRQSLVFLDGTLNRWVPMGSKLSEIDVLKILTDRQEEELKEVFTRTYGLVKTTKFTSIARARWIFRDNAAGTLGMYTYVTEESAGKTRDIVGEKILARYGKEAAESTLELFNRQLRPREDLWIARFPLTTDGSTILHLEAHSPREVIWITEGGSKTEVYYNPEVARELGERIHGVVSELFAWRTAITWHPPYGFMELDEKVRIPTSTQRTLEQLFINTLRKKTGEANHPLEYMFKSTLKLRLGYG